MSTNDSPRRLGRPAGLSVRPELVNEKSFMENMAGLIHEVVPQAYGGSHTVETRDIILWAKFEQIEYNDCLSQSFETHKTSLPFFLVLGYATGVQVWALLATGEAQEMFSWRQGATKIFRFIPNPELANGADDCYFLKRPLVAICDSVVGTSSPYYPVTFLSLRTGEQVKTIRFKNQAADILANRRVVIVTFPEKIAVFNSRTLEDQLILTHCYLSASPSPNPVALGTRWLAYAEKRLLPMHRSGGGFEGEGIQSYTATVIHAAKTLTKGLREFGETFASSLTGQRPISTVSPQGPQPGVVTIIDLDGVGKGEVNLKEDVNGIVAHFIAHANQPVSYLAFDPSGSLLFTADKLGHNFHIFRILPAPCVTKQSAVHHLYTLYRGDTTAKVQDVAFATDSRWIAVTTLRGTTHVFAINPYGGPTGIRTHTSPRVVNRLSRFHRSAGLDDTPSSGRNSPVLSASPSSTRLFESASLFPYPNPRLPPYPHPTVVTPLVQLRSSFIVGNLSNSVRIPTSPGPSSRSGRHPSEDDGTALRISCCFAPPRGAAAIGSLGAHNTGPSNRDRFQRRTSESLYIMSCHGSLVEYALEPRLASGIAREKACDNSAIDLDVVSCAQWMLYRGPQSIDVFPPLPQNTISLMTCGCECDGKEKSPTITSPLGAQEVQESWLAQVEINTHVGPHRRLWMGPQFTFKTVKSNGSSSSLAEIEASDIDILSRPARSNPVNMPKTMVDPLPGLPVITGEGSGSSYEQSPRLLAACVRDRYSAQRSESDSSITDTIPKVEVETQLKENLADAMLEMPAGGSQLPEVSIDRRTHYFIEDIQLNWQQNSLSFNQHSSLPNEDLLDFELESETNLRTSSKNVDKTRHSSRDESSDKEYSFYASDEIVSGLSVDVAFFPDSVRSAGESSSNEEDIVTVPADDGASRTEKKTRKNRKKKK